MFNTSMRARIHRSKAVRAICIVLDFPTVLDRFVGDWEVEFPPWRSKSLVAEKIPKVCSSCIIFIG